MKSFVQQKLHSKWESEKRMKETERKKMIEKGFKENTDVHHVVQLPHILYFIYYVFFSLSHFLCLSQSHAIAILPTFQNSRTWPFCFSSLCYHLFQASCAMTNGMIFFSRSAETFIIFFFALWSCWHQMTHSWLWYRLSTFIKYQPSRQINS